MSKPMWMHRQFTHVRLVLARNVRSRRKDLALSQEQLAFEADIDRTYVSQIERSTINPSLQVLCKVASALKLDVISLLAEKSNSTAHVDGSN